MKLLTFILRTHFEQHAACCLCRSWISCPSDLCKEKEFIVLWRAHFQGKFGLLFYEPSWPTTSTLANMLLERCPRIFVEDCDYLPYACYKEECSLFLLVATFGRQSLSVGLLINYACAFIFAWHFSCVSYARSP